MLAAGLLKSCQQRPQTEVVSFAQDRLAVEQINLTIQHLQRNADAKYFGGLLLLGSACAALVLVAGGYRLALVRRASVHVAKIGASEIPVHHNDLHTLSPVLTGLTTAENLKAFQDGQGRAFDLYCQMAEVQSKQIQALVGRRGLAPAVQVVQQAAALPEHTPTPLAAQTFRELLHHDAFTPGKPLIFGFADGHAHCGTWLDLFSSAIGGQSGQGKTATLRNLIAQSLLTGQVAQFWVVDYHYPHPKSLLATLGDLRALPAIKWVSNPFEIPALLRDVQATIDRRLKAEEPSEPVKVLVCDEVLVLCEKVPVLARTIRRIATESRKAGVYGLFSAQHWKADQIGGSEVRDCLTSRICHQMQRKQANLLLQDRDAAEQAQRLTTGQILFAPVNGQTEILTVPYCDPGDMRAVFTRLNQPESALESTESGLIQGVNQRESAESVLNQTESATESSESVNIRALARSTGIPYITLQRHFSQGRPLKPEHAEKLQNVLTPH